MRYLSWALKILIFVILLSFALQNTAIVTLNTFLGYHWQAPLIFIMLTCFVIGAVFGVLASLTYVIKLRRELTSARKELKNRMPTSQAPVEYILEPPRDAL
jgi:putative membrane protein